MIVGQVRLELLALDGNVLKLHPGGRERHADGLRAALQAPAAGQAAGGGRARLGPEPTLARWAGQGGGLGDA